MVNAIVIMEDKREEEKEFMEELLTRVRVDFESGKVYYRKKYGNKKPGDIAGTFHKKTGYWKLSASKNGRSRIIRLHRFVYYAFHGELPILVDHIDRNKENNSIYNLRSSNKRLNSLNIFKNRSNNTSGVRGVCWNRSREEWVARVRLINGKIISRYSKTKLEAIKNKEKIIKDNHDKVFRDSQEFHFNKRERSRIEEFKKNCKGREIHEINTI